jgi:hypothetical protein
LRDCVLRLSIGAGCAPGDSDDTPAGHAGKPIDFGGPRGATPALTVVKHALRDWVEARMVGLAQDGDLSELERGLNADLRKVGAICGRWQSDGTCPEWTLLGYLGDLKIQRAQGFLVVETGVGIECGFDESAYLYAWSDEGWRRVWQNEQNTYTEKEYQPQKILSVMVSPWNRANDFLILTLGRQTWCQSNLHEIYWRAYRLGPDPLAPALVNGSEFAWIGDERVFHGSVSANDVLVQFQQANPDSSQPAVRHYRIEGGTVKRIDPLALSPQAFVVEWMDTPWKESAHWAEDPNRGTLLDFHDKFKGQIYRATLIRPRCIAAPRTYGR